MVNPRLLIRALFATVLAGLLTAPVGAQTVVFDGGPPNVSGSGNEMTQWIQANDFAFASPTSFNTVRFWTLEHTGTSFLGTITYQIAADSAGTPGGIITSATVVPSVRTLQTTEAGFDVYQYDLNTGNINLAAGTYWLELHNGALSSQNRMEFYWHTTTPGFGNAGEELIAPFTGSWSSNGVDHAFQLLSSAVPEPTTLALVGVGTAGAGLSVVYRRRKNRKNA
jgi:hypothetical protein